MRGAVPLIGLALAAAPLAAQNECSRLFDPALRPGCELAVDAYHTAQRVGGIAISGGDPEPGAIGVLGGLGRAFASVRVTGVSAAIPNPDGSQRAIRSEEHTSELQSHSDLVCRLLLEKKK